MQVKFFTRFSLLLFCCNAVLSDENLIEEVRKYENIYDTQREDYKNRNVRANSWRSIAKALGRSPEDCESRWKNLKETFSLAVSGVP